MSLPAEMVQISEEWVRWDFYVIIKFNKSLVGKKFGFKFLTRWCVWDGDGCGVVLWEGVALGKNSYGFEYELGLKRLKTLVIKGLRTFQIIANLMS